MKKVLALIIICGLLLSLITGCGSQSAPKTTTPEKTQATGKADFSKKVELKWAITGAPNQGSSQMDQYCINLIEERSGGAIKIKYFPNGVLGNNADTLNQVMDGSLDITGGDIATVSAYTDLLEAFQLPFLIDNYEKEWKIVQSKEWKDLLNAASEKMGNAYIFSTSEFGMRHFATISKPIKKMADLKGLKLRCASSKLIMQAMKDIGANPITIPFTELYSALQNRVVDGEEINITSVAMQKHYEVIKYMSLIGMYPYVSLNIASKEVMDSLPEGYWKLIQECMAEAEKWYYTKTLYEWEKQARETCEKNGVVFNTIEDPEKFKEACAHLYNEYAAKDPKIDAFIKLAKSIK
ncbi:MAG: TRAP transporter substrate-binding protein DctP [Peptococcaceae bacterium]|jgi:tripartite ATP-independent transporter DctP family solute receptor|nr:TRAP transporter substrate-binding protein DctP [Peptococcaceae bacterium]MDH7523757.1 TRAP transporter substrate-binding protein DctP [Peptococcaceae bacterium]